jgi:tetratricopeptide (TPR) repeat protein
VDASLTGTLSSRTDRASLPPTQKLHLNEGVIPEPTLEGNRIVLWLPGARSGGFQHWDRVSNLPRSEVTVRQGLRATPAISVPARQALQGIVGKLFRPFRKAPADRAWTLPNGQTAEQHGDRQSDLILVWKEDDVSRIDETEIRAQWPQSKSIQKIGENLFLVSGIEPPAAPGESGQLPPEECPTPAAERLLEVARRRGDRRKEALALTDLGILRRTEGDAKQAATFLEEALAITRELGDRSAERDVLAHLGLAIFALGEGTRALELLEQALRDAREAGDLFAGKMALYHLGLVYASAADPASACHFFDEALTLARQLGDHKQEPELLWYLSIQHAQLGQRPQAIAYAEATVAFLTKLGKPQAAWYAHHLERYRKGEDGGGLDQHSLPGSGPTAFDEFMSGSIVGSFTGSPTLPPSTPQSATGNPSLLRMAFSAAKSMVKFLGSGLKTVPPSVHLQRLQTCTACEHHTGVRCRLCGCFTNAKARLAHEECPIGKWPSGPLG